ncbi:MAG: hypothetical protein KAI71_01355 [Candidatus Pacebacteria bacterium]|nr:hypothetical protein [Candidatus Paceibacterota bacterium]
MEDDRIQPMLAILILPIVQISEEKKEEIKKFISKVTDEMIDNPRGLEGITLIGQMLLSKNVDEMDINAFANMILKDILNDLEEPQRSKLLKKWELIRDSITPEEDDHNCCGDCEGCEHHNPEP